MKVLLLAGGYGTRLYPIIKDTHKALLEIQGKPLINYILDRIEALPVTEILLVTNNKFIHDFEKWQKTVNHDNRPIRVINDHTNSPEDRLGSIGDIHFVLRECDVNDDILIIGGDNLFDFDLNTFFHFSNKHPEHVTIGLYEIGPSEDARKFGVVELNPDGTIKSFEEKPEHPKSRLIAMCFYYLPKATLGNIGAYIKETNKADKAGEYIKWLNEKNNVYGFKFSGKWYDIGSIESYHEAQKSFLQP